MSEDYTNDDAIDLLGFALMREDYARLVRDHGQSWSDAVVIARTAMFSNGTEHDFMRIRVMELFDLSPFLRSAIEAGIRSDPERFANPVMLSRFDRERMYAVEAEERDRHRIVDATPDVEAVRA